MNDKFETAVTLAEKLLLKRGELYVKEIESIPNVASRDEAYAVARRLSKMTSPFYTIEVIDEIWDTGIKLRVSLNDAPLASARKRISA